MIPSELEYPEPDDVAALPSAERKGRTSIDGIFATFDNRRYVHGILPLRFQEAGTEFGYQVWAQLSKEAFDETARLWADPHTRSSISFSAVLANAPAPFEEERGVQLHGRVGPQGERIVFRAAEGAIVEAQSAPGLSREDHSAVLGEAMAEAFTSQIEQHLVTRWGPYRAAEEFRGRDWRRAPRAVTIAEFDPDESWPWRYATMGLSSRPMPATAERIELVWELQRRVDHPSLFEAMARLAGQPWHLRTLFQEGVVQPFPSGFPPLSQFQSFLFFDASRWDARLSGCTVFDEPVRFLCAVPLLDSERNAISTEGYKDFVSKLVTRRHPTV